MSRVDNSGRVLLSSNQSVRKPDGWISQRLLYAGLPSLKSTEPGKARQKNKETGRDQPGSAQTKVEQVLSQRSTRILQAAFQCKLERVALSCMRHGFNVYSRLNLRRHAWGTLIFDGWCSQLHAGRRSFQSLLGSTETRHMPGRPAETKRNNRPSRDLKAEIQHLQPSGIVALVWGAIRNPCLKQYSTGQAAIKR